MLNHDFTNKTKWKYTVTSQHKARNKDYAIFNHLHSGYEDC